MRVEEREIVDDIVAESIAIEDLDLNRETSDDELKVLELQRAKRSKKKLTAKINSNIAVQPVEIRKFQSCKQ